MVSSRPSLQAIASAHLTRENSAFRGVLRSDSWRYDEAACRAWMAERDEEWREILAEEETDLLTGPSAPLGHLPGSGRVGGAW